MDWTRREAMRWMTAAAGVGAVGGLGLPAWAGRREEGKTILPWTKLRDGAWVTDESVQGGHVLAIVGERGVSVVDSKFAFISEAIREDAISLVDGEREGVAPRLINTHHHADHSGGNCSFDSDATMAQANAAPRIERQFDRYIQTLKNGPAAVARTPFAAELMPLVTGLADRAAELSPKDWVPSQLVEDSAEAGASPHADDTGELSLRHFGAGHTDNDLVVHARELNVIHAGDLIFNGLHPFVDRSAGATTLGWINSLNEIEKLCDDETVVVPGHGPVGDGAIVGKMRTYLEQLRESVKADIGNGVSREEATGKTYDFMKGVGFEQLRPRTIGAAYDELTEEG